MGRHVDAGDHPQGEPGNPTPIRWKDGSGGAPHDADRLAQEHDTVTRDVEDAGVVADDRAHDGISRVVLMQQLQAGIKTGEGGHNRQRQVAREARVLADPQAQSQHGHPAQLVAQRELADQLLHLEQVTSHPRRDPVPVGHVFREERRVVWAGAVDGLAGFDDQPADRARRCRATDEDVHGPDHVGLMDRTVIVRRVHHHRQVDHGVDVKLADQLADHR